MYLFTCFDVFRDDLHVLVTIRSALLVPSAESVEYLMYHDTLVVAASTNRDVLRPSDPSDIGITPVKNKHVKSFNFELSRLNIMFLLLKHMHEYIVINIKNRVHMLTLIHERISHNRPG